MKNCEMILAGFGGQGILFTGKILAFAAMLKDKKLSWLPYPVNLVQKRHKKHKPSFIHTLRYFCRTIYGKGFITHSINQIKLFPSDILIFIQHGDPMLRIRNP